MPNVEKFERGDRVVLAPYYKAATIVKVTDEPGQISAPSRTYGVETDDGIYEGMAYPSQLRRLAR